VTLKLIKNIRILGVSKDILEASQIPCENKNSKCDPLLSKNLMELIRKCVTPGKQDYPLNLFPNLDTTIRPITLELCCVVIRGIVLALEDDDALISSFTDLAIDMQKKLAQKLSEVIFSEDLFLEMFEEEYCLIEVRL
jgi:hypothetical protein